MPQPSPDTAGVRFLGERNDFFRLLARGSLFLMVTLGIYRFWLNTDVRRFLWSNTEVAGESLEYTGTPFELLIGFLIAIAILVPIYALLFLATLQLGTIGQFSGAIGFVLLTVLGQYAVYRARRYRLTRTVYRGVRFHQDGSAWRYAVCALFWWTLTILTVGLAYPWKESRLERFKMRNTYYGNVQGAFASSGLRLFLRGLPMWIVVVLPLIAAVVAFPATADLSALKQAIAQGDGGADVMSRIEGANPQLYAVIVFAMLAGVWSMIMGAVLYPAFQAMLIRWWASGIRFGDLVVKSKLRTASIYGGYMRCLGYSLLFSLFLGVVIGTLTVSLMGILGAIKSAPPQAKEILTVGIGLISYVVSMLGYSAIYQSTVKFAFWRFGAESLELSGIHVLDQVQATGGPSSPVGEGLADALNVGGF
ncbi:MAG TPA: DUF898 family protein [Pseudolabrys sp.]|nr:DUF898 family protein [Pseudolabrys sp.]